MDHDDELDYIINTIVDIFVKIVFPTVLFMLMFNAFYEGINMKKREANNSKTQVEQITPSKKQFNSIEGF